MTPIPDNATGVWCAIRYHDEDDVLSPVFFSFGEYDEQTDPVYDTFGHRDDLVFYYTTPEELPLLMSEGGHDFTVVGVEYYEVAS